MALFETATDAIVVTRAGDHSVVDANPAACELYGYTLAEITSLSVVDLSDEPEKTVASIEADEPRVQLRNHRTKDGTAFPVSVSASNFELNGQLVRVAYIHDITGRLAAEAAVRASEEKFENVFRVSPDAVNINRLSDGVFLEINHGFTAITGYTEADVLGRSSCEIDLWADPKDRAFIVDRLLEKGAISNYEVPFRLKDGSVRTGLISARVLTVADELSIISVTRDIHDRKAAEKALERSNQRLYALVEGTIEALGRTVEIRDPYTSGHERRVAQISIDIAMRLGMTDDDVVGMKMAALVHDVGKLGIPSEILTKPGKLSDKEYRLIQDHTLLGHDILKGIDTPWPLAEIVLQHHERMDGTGYPNRLAGEDILMPARILAVADVVEAMSSRRPYRPALGVDASLAELAENPDRYDADVVRECLALHQAGQLAFLEN
jgi:PAS domain S-box-containing protein